MDSDVRLRALSRLAESATSEAESALQKEMQNIRNSLTTETRYDHLEESLSLLEVIGHRFSRETVEILLSFIRAIEARRITYGDELGIFADRVSEYQNANTLIGRAIEVLGRLRYLETKQALWALVDLSHHKSETVREKAEAGLKALARYDLRVFFGDKGQEGIGAAPQKLIVQELEALPDEKLRDSSSVALLLLSGVLSPTVEGTSWTYNTLTLSRAATPALPEIADIRLRAIGLLKRLYGLIASAGEKLGIIGILSEASRTHSFGGENAEVERMIARDTIDVLSFFKTLVAKESLDVVQKVESRSYWMFFHAPREDVRVAARAVERAIKGRKEYQIYKTLIGFESVFGDWGKLSKDRSLRDDTDKMRRGRALEYARSIRAKNYSEWRLRILSYAKTESDDLATFPVFYHFLESFALANPGLALKFVTEDAQRIERFLIPLLRGLWAGPRKDAAKRLIESWLREGRYLYQSTKLFLDNPRLDVSLVLRLLRRANELDELHTIALTVSVAVSNYSLRRRGLLNQLFLPALEGLTEKSSANWIFDIWYRPQGREVISALDARGIDSVLRNLLFLSKIDYQAEEILSVVAQEYPEKVLMFLMERLERSRDKRVVSLFDAIPYEMHKLNAPLSKIPRKAVQIVRKSYDGDFSMLIHGGGHLLKTIFPAFSPDFERELLALVASGRNDDLEFVLAILRNYEGQLFIHNVAKQIVRRLPSKSKYLSEVAAALSTTGVVSGPYGFAEAYERKRKEIEGWLAEPDEGLRAFATQYMSNLERMSVADRMRADEELALRKERYGE